ncbi:MAG: transcriptional regulator, LuxR family protein [Marmoricola sp.]|nr:transcriptional regulator, LuxR family protein [Marmoricola sp.]
MVTGEAGAGKSSLVRTALDGHRADWGYCEPLDIPRPLGPFRDIVAGRAIDEVELGETGLGEQLLELLRSEPRVLVIEDAHWLDDASARVLRFLGRRIASTRGLVAVTTRDDVTTDHLRQVLGDLATSPSLVRLELEPLSEAGIAELIDGSGLDVAETRLLTGGNPFLVSALLEDPGHAVSTAVRDVAVARAARLPAPARAALRSLAVVPGRIRLADIPEYTDVLDDLVESGLIRVTDGYLEFRHELVRRALDHELTPEQRRRAHSDALTRLDQNRATEPARLAFHAGLAGRSDEALVHERAAASAASASGAHTQAAGHFRRAVDLAEPRSTAAELVELLLHLAREEQAIGHDLEAASAAARALALAEAGAGPDLVGAALLMVSVTVVGESEALTYGDRAIVALEEAGAGPELAAASPRRRANARPARTRVREPPASRRARSGRYRSRPGPGPRVVQPRVGRR